jgi:hypothetical protein
MEPLPQGCSSGEVSINRHSMWLSKFATSGLAKPNQMLQQEFASRK